MRTEFKDLVKGQLKSKQSKLIVLNMEYAEKIISALVLHYQDLMIYWFLRVFLLDGF